MLHCKYPYPSFSSQFHCSRERLEVAVLFKISLNQRNFALFRPAAEAPPAEAPPAETAPAEEAPA